MTKKALGLAFSKVVTLTESQFHSALFSHASSIFISYSTSYVVSKQNLNLPSPSLRYQESGLAPSLILFLLLKVGKRQYSPQAPLLVGIFRPPLPLPPL